MGYVWIIASRYLRSTRRLNFITLVSLLAMGGVLVGVAALTIVLSVMNGFEDQVQQRIAGTNAHVAVLGGEDAPIPPDRALERAILGAVPDARLAPFVYGKVMVASRHGIDGMVLKGVDPDRERQVTDILARLTPAAGSFDGGDLDGIALGQELASRLRVIRGDVILISVPSEEGGILGGAPRSLRLRVHVGADQVRHENEPALQHADQVKLFTFRIVAFDLGGRQCRESLQRFTCCRID